MGDFAGWGRGAAFGDAAWTTQYAALVDDCVRSGCRKVYFPTPAYDWSFLHLFTTLDLKPGAKAVALPDDCSGLEGDIVVSLTGSSSWLPRVPVSNPGRIKALYAQGASTTGRLVAAAIEQMKGTQVVSGQRQQLIVYPAADQDYTLTVQYYVVPNAPGPAPSETSYFPGVTAGDPYVYGGAAHAETFLEAALSVFEQRRDDMLGLHTQLFQERLAASMAVDRRSKAQALGPNYDSSDDAEGGSRRRYADYQTRVLYNGISTN